jgi:glycosyltransferase 2 family protein
MSGQREPSRLEKAIKTQFRSKARNRTGHLVSLGKWLFTPLALIFLLAAVWQSRLIIGNTLVHCLPVYFIFSVLVWMIAYLMSPVFSCVVLSACGVKVGYSQVLDLHLSYLPARYIPGGIWHTVARINGLHHIGVQAKHLSSLVILENLVPVGVALFTGGVLVGFNQVDRAWQPVAFLAAITSLMLLPLCPILVNRLVLKSVGKICYRNYMVAVFSSIIFWSLATTSFLLFIFALPGSFVTSTWLEIAGVYLFSWGMGFLAIFAPQGVGVFEVVAADIMPTSLPFNALVALLAGFRLVVILADVVMWGGWHIRTYFIKRASLKK